MFFSKARLGNKLESLLFVAGFLLLVRKFGFIERLVD